jgi:DNA-binding MarR family transcriptional regulator
MATIDTNACPTDSDLSPADAEAWFGLLHAQGALVREVDAALLAEHRLPLSAYELLFRLGANPEGLAVSELGRVVMLSPSRVSRVVDDLVALGLVERRRCDTDARISYVGITDKGRDAIPAIDATFAAAVRRHFIDRLTRRDLDNLVKITRKLAAS